MSKVSLQDAAVAVLLTILVGVVLFWRLGAPTFWDPDEAHYAETSREMVATHDWWAPYYNEQPFFDKPVLFHQLQAAAMLAIADPELAARVVPATASLALIAVTAWFGWIMLSRDVAATAALMLAANPAVFALSRYAILDTLFTLFTFGGAALLAVAALKGRPRLQWPGYAALAVGVLIKGPLALVLVGLTFLLLLALSAELRPRLLALRWAVGVAIVVAIAAPWFVYMLFRFKQEFVNGYVLDENLRLFASSRFENQPGFDFYARILTVGMLPWTGILVGRIVDDVRAVITERRMDAVETLLLTWSAAILVFFSLSTFKLDHYIFPAVPALCLLCARGWCERPARAGARVGVVLVGPVLVLSGGGLAFLLATRLDLGTAALAAPVALIAGGVATMRATRRSKPAATPWQAVASMAVLYAVVIACAMPRLEERKVIPDIAAWVAARAQPSDRIASYQLNRWTPAFRFYVDRHTEFLDDPPSLSAFASAGDRMYVVMRRDAHDALVAAGMPLEILYEREGMAVTSGRTLWRRREPPVRYVVVGKPR